MIYKKKYINDNEYIILQVYDNGYEREIHETRQAYIDWLVNNTLEVIPYIAPIIPIEEIYKSKLDEIEYQYLEIFKLGFTPSIGIKIKCEFNDQLRWADNLLILITYGLTTTDIQDFDDHIHTITFDEYKQLCLEVAGYVKYLAGVRWYLITMANTAYENNDIETLKGITWP